MGKVVIAEKILLGNYAPVALKHANIIIERDKLYGPDIQTDINNAQSPQEFAAVFKKYFGDELKLIPA